MSDAFQDLEQKPLVSPPVNPPITAQQAPTMPQTVRAPLIQSRTVPLGYIPIRLSVGGHFGIPKEFHMRNFTTGELVDISLFNEDELPQRVITALNSMIFEDIDVALFPDKAVIETLVAVYANFFQPIIRDAEFPWTKEDIDFLKNNGQEARAKLIQDRVEIPRFDLDLRLLNRKEVADGITNFVTITRKQPVEFSVTFLSYPRYGDRLLLQKFMRKKFEEEDKKWSDIRKRYDLIRRYMEEEKDASVVPEVTDEEYENWQNYELAKIAYSAKATLAIYLHSFNGVDYSKASIEERIRVVENPVIDVGVSRALDKAFKKLDFGITPTISIMNPITKEVVQRDISFRVLDILQAIQISDSNGYDFDYHD